MFFLKLFICIQTRMNPCNFLIFYSPNWWLFPTFFRYLGVSRPQVHFGQLSEKLWVLVAVCVVLDQSQSINQLINLIVWWWCMATSLSPEIKMCAELSSQPAVNLRSRHLSTHCTHRASSALACQTSAARARWPPWRLPESAISTRSQSCWWLPLPFIDHDPMTHQLAIK